MNTNTIAIEIPVKATETHTADERMNYIINSLPTLSLVKVEKTATGVLFTAAGYPKAHLSGKDLAVINHAAFAVDALA